MHVLEILLIIGIVIVSVALGVMVLGELAFRLDKLMDRLSGKRKPHEPKDDQS
jgi:hypothetical protein